MDELIRDFFERRKERRFLRKRLDRVIDRMMAERIEEAVEEKKGVSVQSLPPDANPGMSDDPLDFEQAASASEFEQAMAASQVADEPIELQEEEEKQEPHLHVPPVNLDDLLAQLIDEQDAGLLPRRQSEHSLVYDASPMQSSLLDELRDEQVDDFKTWLHRFVRQNLAGSLQQKTSAKAPRRKHVDARATVKRLARTGGAFNGFCYRPSPSEVLQNVDAPHLLVIADVSGSMGRYVAVILYLLACLEEVAQVDSYVFSDATTYASDLLGKGVFREQFARLKQGAASWEYGTRLGQAMQDVLRDGKFRENTRVVLMTDGGFSLIGSDWQETVQGMLALQKCVESLHLVTPNPQLAGDGPACAEALWNVERDPRQAHELLDPRQQKIARFGLLARYSEQISLCRTANDFLDVLKNILL